MSDSGGVNGNGDEEGTPGEWGGQDVGGIAAISGGGVPSGAGGLGGGEGEGAEFVVSPVPKWEPELGTTATTPPDGKRRKRRRRSILSEEEYGLLSPASVRTRSILGG